MIAAAEGSKRCKVLLIGTFILSVAISLPALHLAWYGDQALFAYGARVISRGGRLYVDFWDNKQPGVYWFFLAGGKLFGSFGLGPRILELAWLGLGSLLSAWAMQVAGHDRFSIACIPLMTLAAYYASANSTILTQVESLVALPLAACILVATLADRPGAQRQWLSMAAFGGCAALVGVFKLVLLPVPAAILCAGLVARRASLKDKAAWMVWASVGGLVAGAVALLPFLLQRSLKELWWTAIVYPVHALREGAGAPFSRILGSAMLFVRSAGVIPALAVYGFLVSWRRGGAARRLGLMLAGWSLAAAFTIVVQRLSWWSYHFALLVWPLGVLAAVALGELNSRFSATSSRRVVLFWAAAVCVMAPLVFRAARTAVRVAQSRHGHTFQVESIAVAPGSGQEAAIAALPSTLDPGCASVYVFGDPTVQLAARAPAALATHGWAWELFLGSQWSRLRTELRTADPMAIYLDSDYRRLIEEKAVALLEDLGERYRIEWRGTGGDVWLVRQGARQQGPCGPTLPFSVP